MTAATISATGTVQRVVAVDLARLVAVVGMMGAHVVLPQSTVWSGQVGFESAAADVVAPFVNGNASTLFAVLGGVSMVLATRGLLMRCERGAAWRSIAARAAVLVVLGLILTALGPPVIVVLQYFGWSMLLAAPLLLAPTWVVGASAGVLALAGPFVNEAVRSWRYGASLAAPVPDPLEGSPLAPLVDLTVTGEYPAITWVCYLAVGMLLGRWLLRSRSAARTRWFGGTLVAAGVVAVAAASITSAIVVRQFVPGFADENGLAASTVDFLLLVGDGGAAGREWWWQLTAIAHTGTWGDIVRGLGASAVVVGALIALLPPGRDWPRWLAPARAAGGAPLTLYTLHVVVLLVAWVVASVGEAFTWVAGGVGAWLLHVAIALLVGWALAATGRRGPLEALTSGAAGWAAGRGPEKSRLSGPPTG